MLALTPPLGWNSWNMFGATIDAEIVKGTADAFVSTGLQAAGYEYIVVNDHRHGGRAADGRLFPDPLKFPQGMPAITDYVHARGLKFGIYSDAGPLTCGGCPGSQDHEELDARTFSEWGVDFLKYDWCQAEDTRANAEYRYSRMSAALRATGREIVFSVCEWGHHSPWLWAAKSGGQLWRTTGDIGDSWNNVVAKWGGLLYGIDSIGFEQQRGLEAYAGQGHWNDTDMLVVGLRGRSREIAGTGCTDDEYRTHFSLWCLLAAPLMIGCDVRQMDAATSAILTNPEALAVDQDLLGSQGFRLSRNGLCELWKKPLAGDQFAVGLFNRGDRAASLTAHWSDLQLSGRYRLRDLWAHADLGIYDSNYQVELAPHSCTLLRLVPEK